MLQQHMTQYGTVQDVDQEQADASMQFMDPNVLSSFVLATKRLFFLDTNAPYSLHC